MRGVSFALPMSYVCLLCVAEHGQALRGTTGLGREGGMRISVTCGERVPKAYCTVAERANKILDLGASSSWWPLSPSSLLLMEMGGEAEMPGTSKKCY